MNSVAEIRISRLFSRFEPGKKAMRLHLNIRMDALILRLQ